MKKRLDHIRPACQSPSFCRSSLAPVEKDNSSDRQYFGRKSDGHRCLEPKKSKIWIWSLIYCSFWTGCIETDSNSVLDNECLDAWMVRLSGSAIGQGEGIKVSTMTAWRSVCKERHKYCTLVYPKSWPASQGDHHHLKTSDLGWCTRGSVDRGWPPLTWARGLPHINSSVGKGCLFLKHKCFVFWQKLVLCIQTNISVDAHFYLPYLYATYCLCCVAFTLE